MAELARIEAKTAAPPMPSKPFDVMASMAICQRLAGMDKTARNDALGKAAKDGDERVLSAVLNSPALLSGLTENELQAARHNWQSRVFADEVDRVERIKKAVAVLDIGGQALLKWADALTPSDQIANAEAAEAEAREAMTAA